MAPREAWRRPQGSRHTHVLDLADRIAKLLFIGRADELSGLLAVKQAVPRIEPLIREFRIPEEVPDLFRNVGLLVWKQLSRWRGHRLASRVYIIPPQQWRQLVSMISIFATVSGVNVEVT